MTGQEYIRADESWISNSGTYWESQAEQRRFYALISK